MSFEDFARHFTQLDIVHVSPDDWMTEPALHSKQPWRAVLARRRWRSGYNAGGGPGYPETTAMNPQFHVGIPRTSGNKCHVVVSVVQQYETDPDAKGARPLCAIGFAVYEVPHSTSRLSPQFVGQQVSRVPRRSLDDDNDDDNTVAGRHAVPKTITDRSLFSFDSISPHHTEMGCGVANRSRFSERYRVPSSYLKPTEFFLRPHGTFDNDTVACCFCSR